MERLTVFRTDKGRYSVRPIDFEGIWDKQGRIQEKGFNHTGIFQEREDAEFFARTKNLEEEGKLLKLPCKPGDTVYICKGIATFGEIGDKSKVTYRVDKLKFDYWMIPYFGKNVFLTEQEAKEALERMEK